MNKRLFLVLLLFGSLVTPVMGQQTSPDPDIGGIVMEFFGWYTNYLEIHDYQMDDAYQTSPYLTSAFVDDLTVVFASDTGIDPILCASTLPELYRLEVSDYSGDTAIVLMRQHFSSPLTHNIEIDMILSDNSWKINDVRCEDTVTPRGVVQKFYADWLDYAQYDKETETMNNPIVDQIWQQSGLVTDNLVQTLDDLTRPETWVGYDPVLCAQDFPSRVLPLEIDIRDGQARVLMNEFFGESIIPNRVLVTLTNDNNNWYIDSISCGVAPEIITLSFYRLYLDFSRYDLDHGFERTPLIDWTFPWDIFLSGGLKNRLFNIFNTGERLAVDPVLCTREIPAWVDVSRVSATDNSVQVNVTGIYGTGPDSSTAYDLANIEFILEGTRWIIENIRCV